MKIATSKLQLVLTDSSVWHTDGQTGGRQHNKRVLHHICMPSHANNCR